jgi:hypothetical protein
VSINTISHPRFSEAALIRIACVLLAASPVLSFVIQHALESRSFFTSAGGVALAATLLLLMALRHSEFRQAEWLAMAFAIAAAMHSLILFGDVKAAMHGSAVGVAALLCVRLVRHDNNSAICMGLFTSMAAAGASLVLLPLFIWTFPDIYTDQQWTYEIPGFMNIRVVGQWAAVGTVISVGGAAIERDRRKIPWLILATLSCSVIFWSGSRGGALAALLGCLAMLAFGRKRIHRPLVSILSVTVAMVTAAALSLLAPYPNNLFGLMTRLLRTAELISDGDDPTSKRLDIWAETLSRALDKFWYGNGLLRLPDVGGTHANSHNIVLDTIFAWGIPAGGALLAALAVSYIVGMSRSAKSNIANHVPAIGVATALLAYALVEPIHFSPAMRLTFAAALAVLLINNRSQGVATK